ncbi:MAG TPA: OmpA family protein [Acetobacteraceae bacterium]|nr:OmpA family protein [Acetobacteraceae bacterium]
MKLRSVWLAGTFLRTAARSLTLRAPLAMGATALVGATVLGGALVCVPRQAQAQPVTGIYFGGGGGANLVQDERVRISPFFPGGKERFDAGYVGVGSAGYGFGNGIRVEVEGNYRYNGLQHFLSSGLPNEAGGQQQNYGVMANALFDMDIGLNWLYPYFGGGVGYSWTNWSHIQANSVEPPFNERVGGTYGTFAYQAMFGLSFPIAYVPGLSMTAEYRFFSVVGNAQFDASSSGVIGASGVRPAGVSRGNLDIRTDYNHSFLLGLRYELNPVPPAEAAPAPTPVAAPAPEPARTYLVFFDWDRADLTARARQIIAEAAQASTRVQTTRIEVNGYTDLSGTAAYNQRLSVRRAQSVEAELIRDGVPRNEILIHGYGESNPLVPTAKGVREPQNRRVEIILH